MKHPGKLNKHENTCPWCNTYGEWSDESIEVMELSAQRYKLCIKCGGRFVDTYLIHFIYSDHEDSRENWEESERWEDEDHPSLFHELNNGGALIFDEDNPDKDEDYYDNPNNTELYMEKL